MHKDYIENEYRLAVSDFKLAKNEDEQWDARKRMAKLEQIASSAYGFEYADSLKVNPCVRHGYRKLDSMEF